VGSPVEGTDVYRRSCALANDLATVSAWPPFARDTLGTQLIQSIDSVAANLVEGDARGSDKDAARFFVVARASAREARRWLVWAGSRRLLGEARSRELVSELTEMVKSLIAHRRSRVVKEEGVAYDRALDELTLSLTLILITLGTSGGGGCRR
jgi:four helix bundle protein